MNLKGLFPHGSDAFFEINGQLSSPKPQQDAPMALGKKGARKAKIRGRIGVVYRCFSCRPFDADNLAGATKAGQDVLTAVGLLPADDPYSISVTWEQVKIAHFADEKLEIEITK